MSTIISVCSRIYSEGFIQRLIGIVSTVIFSVIDKIISFLLTGCWNKSIKTKFVNEKALFSDTFKHYNCILFYKFGSNKILDPVLVYCL